MDDDVWLHKSSIDKYNLTSNKKSHVPSTQMLILLLISSVTLGAALMAFARSIKLAQPSRPDTADLAAQSSPWVDVVDSSVWSDVAERGVEPGFDDVAHSQWHRALHLHSRQFHTIRPGCGRMQNRAVWFSPQSRRACVRYRVNVDEIRGELFTYHLARLLGIHNVPPTALFRIDHTTAANSNAASEMRNAGWRNGTLVVVTQFVPNLRPAYAPRFLHANLSLTPGVLHSHYAASSTPREVAELIQWSDMLALDYLSANLDRFVNTLVNQQWNSNIFHESTHNLERNNRGLLLFLDNESGLFHGYRLIHRYGRYMESTLANVCIFRRSLKANVAKLLSQTRNFTKTFNEFVIQNDKLAAELPSLPSSVSQILIGRLKKLQNHFTFCEQKKH